MLLEEKDRLNSPFRNTDCTACRWVWLSVESKLGNSQIEEDIYDAFTNACIEAQKSKIFYAAVSFVSFATLIVRETDPFLQCEDMFDDVYGMIGDYLVSDLVKKRGTLQKFSLRVQNGYTVGQVCEGAKMCR